MDPLALFPDKAGRRLGEAERQSIALISRNARATPVSPHRVIPRFPQKNSPAFSEQRKTLIRGYNPLR
ncbi:hypothetical protein JKG47_07110 [Acidithiobacillus sp. MC6.1]|nr:hypothetical protein [Acidithiobacillus sp. MC6.1]